MVEEMDNETALTLFSEGGILIIHDMSPGTEFGIDYNSWNIGDKFKGVKMIPPGFHFIYYAAVGSSGQAAPRTGFFHYFKQKEIVVKKWDRETEDVVDQVMSDEELNSLRAGLQSLDQYLGKYPYESLKKWVSLTGNVTEPLMLRTQPICKRISSVTEVAQQSFQTSPYKLSSNESCEMERVSFDTALRFTPILLRQFPSGASPSDITKLGMDKSKVLEDIMVNFKEVKEILGELQLAFVTFLVGQGKLPTYWYCIFGYGGNLYLVYDAFEQWKTLIHLLCSCTEAVDKYPDLFEAFIGVIHFQLLETPEDFFVDIVSKNNFLVDNLHKFFVTLRDSSVSAKLKRRSQKFKEYLTKRFHWDFDVEPEEDAPVILEI